jgi:Leucine-rich repeat (LRR) protein
MVHLKKELLLQVACVLLILALLGLLLGNLFIKTMRHGGEKQKISIGAPMPRPTQTAFRTADSYSGIDYTFNPEHDAIADNAVCRDVKTFTYTSFAPALVDPEHACSLVISSDDELKNLASLSGRLTHLKILKITNTSNTRLPAEIGQIKSLGRLIIQNTKGTVLPPEIGKLTNLVELALDDAHVAQLPAEIGQLTNLEELTVSNNKELQSLPLEIVNLPYLWKIIAINDNLSTLPILPRLQYGTVLSLKGNKLTEFPIVLLSKKRVIVSLDLSDNMIQFVPDAINETQIRVLTMSNNELSSFPQIDKMTLLSLNLSGNYLTEISSLPSKKWLRQLDLSNNRLTSIALSLTDMNSLQSLILGGNQFAILPALPDAKDMRILDISFNKLSSLPEGVERLKGLKRINMSGNRIPQGEREKVKDLFPNAEIIY